MTASSLLTASPREMIGKTSHKLAARNQIPAVLYGPGRDPMPLALDRHEFELFVTHHAAGSTVVDLEIDGEKKPISAMIREVQHSAVKGNVLHVDLLAVSMNKPIHAVVVVRLVNDPEGVKAGGVLTVNVHEVNVEAKPGDLPDAIDIDVAALQVGDSLHVSDIVAPAGVTILDDPEAIVASVQPPRLEAEEAPALEEGAEPEIVGGKGEAEEE